MVAAVDQAEQQMALERSDTATGATGEVVKVVGDKVFLLREGVWTDTAFDIERMQVVRVGFMSEDYFQLAAARPEWGAYLAVGERVLVVLPGEEGPIAYQVVEQGDGEPIQLPAPQATATPVVRVPSPTFTPTPPVHNQADRVHPMATPVPPARGNFPLCRGAAATMSLALIAALLFARRR